MSQTQLLLWQNLKEHTSILATLQSHHLLSHRLVLQVTKARAPTSTPQQAFQKMAQQLRVFTAPSEPQHLVHTHIHTQTITHRGGCTQVYTPRIRTGRGPTRNQTQQQSSGERPCHCDGCGRVLHSLSILEGAHKDRGML